MDPRLLKHLKKLNLTINNSVSKNTNKHSTSKLSEFLGNLLKNK